MPLAPTARAWLARQSIGVARVEDLMLCGPGGPLVVRLY